VAASPRRQKLIPTRYLPHRLLVKRVPHLVRNGTRMCSRLQQVAVFPMGPPCLLTCSPRSAAPSGQGLSHCGPPVIRYPLSNKQDSPNASYYRHCL
jgi:hypothetical protein